MSNPRNDLKALLISNIDFSGYDNKQDTLYEVFNTFVSEYMHPSLMAKVGGSMPKAITEWLMGLPSCVDMPFYYHEITNLMYALGYDIDKENFNGASELYFNELGEIIYESAKQPA